MPKSKRPPKYCKLKKYAVIYLNGKTIYLGRYESPESRKEYARICAEIEGNPTFPLHGAKDITLDEVAVAYLDHAEQRFGKGSHYENYRVALKFATDLYGHRPVDEFSPLKLRTVRDVIVRTRGGTCCRKTINRMVDRVRTALSWGVSMELLESRIVDNLRKVKPLPEQVLRVHFPSGIPKTVLCCITEVPPNKYLREQNNLLKAILAALWRQLQRAYKRLPSIGALLRTLPATSLNLPPTLISRMTKSFSSMKC